MKPRLQLAVALLALPAAQGCIFLGISSPAEYGLDIRVAHVVRANEPRFGETGTATLTFNAGTHTLRVTGVNDMGETMDMTAVCKPAPEPGDPIAHPRTALPDARALARDARGPAGRLR